MNLLSPKSIRIVIFAKAPLPGFAKTRLIPALGEEGASQLAAKLLAHTVDEAVSANIGSVELCVSPTILHPIWKTMSFPPPLEWCEQGDGDLGQRMARASQRVTNSDQAVLLIGTDCPELTADTLRVAAEELNRHDAVMVPVVDGGYALLGLRQHLPSVFVDIPWSTSSVASLTRERILDVGLKLKQLDVFHDIDEPQDLQHLPVHWMEPS